MKIKGLIIIFILVLNEGSFTYQLPSPMSLQLIIEYAKLRSWKNIVLFDDLSSKNDGIMNYARPLLNCLGKEGISVSIQPTNSPKLPEALEIRTHRVGAVVFIDKINFTSPDNVLNLSSSKRLFDYYISWLLITERSKDASIDTNLRNLTIGINTDVITATAYYDNQQILLYLNRTCQPLQIYGKKYKLNIQKLDDNNYHHHTKNATKNLDYSNMENRTACFYLLHIYKIRINDNSSLVIDSLGSWCPGLSFIKLPINVALRNNFFQLPIQVGILNGTSDDQNIETLYQEDQNEVQPFNDFLDFLANSLNSSLETVTYEKVGTLANKVWNNLLGDVYNGNVDIGLGYITINDERQRDMSFTHPLIRYTRNIYVRPPESGTMRDIFLQPFNNRLFFCVALMQIFIISTIGTINYAASNVLYDKKNEKQNGIGEATLWCASIMCMQGSPWNPSSLSGKTALIASLMFSLVTYNAYAGFITSILSVQATGIRNLEDLLKNNYKLGYSDIDDEYMRNANDSDLRQLYIKAFNGRESALSTTLGLQKSVQGGYGFFVSATLARRALRTSLIHARCSLKEIEVKQTFTIVALPMEKNSPYEKIINLSILRMRERGVITRIGERMLPDMPKCHEHTTFHTARIADVYSAFIILAVGVSSAFCLGILERIWYQKKNLKNKLIKALSSHTGKNNNNNNKICLEKKISNSEGLVPRGWQPVFLGGKYSTVPRVILKNKNSRDNKNWVFPFHH